MNIELTHHALVRARERLGWHGPTLARMVERVFYFGLHSETVHGSLRRYLESKGGDRGSTVRAYGEHVFVFKVAAEPVASLITVYPIPGEFRRHLHRARANGRRVSPLKARKRP